MVRSTNPQFHTGKRDPLDHKAHRDAHGAFTNREGLRRVKGMKAHYFQQSAGFLRVVSGDEALDATSVHPESYTLARDLQSRTQGRSLQQIVDEGILDSVAEDLSCGRETLRDIATQLLGSAEDPRDRQPQPLLKRAFGDRSKPSNDGAWDAQDRSATHFNFLLFFVPFFSLSYVFLTLC